MSKPPQKQTLDNWIVSSFGNIGAECTIPKKKVNQKTKIVLTTNKSSNVPNDALWIDKYKPNNEVELAVHKKKYEDVNNWFKSYSSTCGRRSPMLLLTGPAGAGKSATVRVLTLHFNMEICEWINQPGVSVNYGTQTYEESQSKTFKDFLMRAGRYTNQIFVGSQCRQKIIVIEDFPNTFQVNVAEFHSLLRLYSRVGTCALVFIVTDSANNSTNELKLFPSSFQQELSITKLSFNPVAHTNMVRALMRIAEAEGLDISKSALDMLVESCRGDIRSAVNALQFGCETVGMRISKPVQRVLKKRSHSSSKKHVPTDDISNSALVSMLGSRDDSLFLFHALGKILYCKRDTEKAVPSMLPRSLQDMERAPLLVNPEDVWEKTATSGATFGAFLHENYIHFSTDVNDICRISQYLSASDVLSSEWMDFNVLDPYVASIVSRGIMHSNKLKKNVGFKALHKPRLFSMQKSCRETYDVVRNIFKEYYVHLSREEFIAQVIPCLRNFMLPVLKSDQKMALCNMFPPLSFSNKMRNKLDILQERDTEMVEMDNRLESGPTILDDYYQSLQLQIMQDSSGDEEDKYVIEEFDF